MLEPTSPPSPKDGFEPSPPWFATRMALGFALQFVYVGLYLPYFPLWLESRELSPLQISTVLSMSLVIRVLASGQVMVFADRQDDRSVLLSWLYVGSALTIVLYAPATGFWAILLVTLLYNVFFNPVLPLLDAITLSGVRRFDADYGRIRIWGSVAFILANLGGGIYLLNQDADFILLALVVAMIAGAAFSFALPRIGRKNPYRKSAESDARRWTLLTDRRFVLVLVACGLGQASHAFLYGFGSIYWQAIGMSGAMIGTFWGIGVFAEIVLFQFSKSLLARFSATGLIAIGCLGGVARWFMFPLIDTEPAFMLLQIFHGLSFGAVHIGLMQFIMEQVSDDDIGAAQGAGYVLGGAIMGIAVFSSGPLYEAVGVQGFLVMAMMCVIALILLALPVRKAT